MAKFGKYILAATLLLVSCASLFGGEAQNISVATSNGKKAACHLANAQGSWNVVAPATVEVKTSNSALKIYCSSKKLSIKGSKFVKADQNGNYPAKIIVKLNKATAMDMPSDADEPQEDRDSEPLNRLPEDPDTKTE